MLIYFKVGNFRSIKEPVILNFRANTLSEHNQSNTFTEGGEKLIKSLLLYGHNASGKSKILDALVLFKYLITNPAITSQRNEPLPVEPFVLNEATMGGPSYFEAFFLVNKVKYRYGFEADRDGVHKEWLLESKIKKENPLFLRMKDQFQIDKKRFENASGLERRTRKNALFISVASQWNVKTAEKINRFFADIFTIHGVMDHYYEKLTIDLLQDDKYSSIIKELITKADLGINDIGLVDLPMLDDNDDGKDQIVGTSHITLPKKTTKNNEKTVYTLHTRYNAKNEKIQMARFFMDAQESEGTKKYLNLIGPIVFALYNNQIVIIDEFDARLHSLLTKAILKIFNSSVFSTMGQLLVATHDTSLLDRNILRRDQIGFVEKDFFGATNLTMLSTYKPRKEAPYDKNYLEGKYGAIPVIEEFEKILANGKE